MAKNKLTVGGFFALIMFVLFLFWFVPIWVQIAQDPMNPEIIEDVAEKMVDEAIPTPVKIIIGIVTIFGGSLFAVALIFVVVKGWDYVMNQPISLGY